MEQALGALSQSELTHVAVSAIIAKAAALSRDPECDKWLLYESAKGAIGFYELTTDEYERAIKMLTEALKI